MNTSWQKTPQAARKQLLPSVACGVDVGGANVAAPRADAVVDDDQGGPGQGPAAGGEEDGADGVPGPPRGEAEKGVLHVREEGVHVVPEDAAGDLPDEADALG